jgi:hypothetical protein
MPVRAYVYVHHHHTQDVRELATEHLTAAKTSFYLCGKSGQILGSALRATQEAKNPVFVSPGHMISIDTATGTELAIVLLLVVCVCVCVLKNLAIMSVHTHIHTTCNTQHTTYATTPI